MIIDQQEQRGKLRIVVEHEIEGVIYTFVAHRPLGDDTTRWHNRHHDALVELLNRPPEPEVLEPLVPVLLRYSRDEINTALEDDEVKARREA